MRSRYPMASEYVGVVSEDDSVLGLEPDELPNMCWPEDPQAQTGLQKHGRSSFGRPWIEHISKSQREQNINRNIWNYRRQACSTTSIQIYLINIAFVVHTCTHTHTHAGDIVVQRRTSGTSAWTLRFRVCCVSNMPNQLRKPYQCVAITISIWI